MTIHLRHERERYWAGQEDPELILASCEERVNRYVQGLKDTNLHARIMRNWRYYHGLFYGTRHVGSFMELKQLGELGKLTGAAFNHFRSIARHIVSMITQDPISYEPRALNTDQESLSQARLARAVLDYYTERDHIEEVLIRALEHALIFNQGYVLTEWDERRGRRIAGQSYTDENGEERTEYYFEGDVKLSNPTIFDVVCDLSARTWEEHQWFIVRSFANKWDLIAQYPDLEEKLMALDQHNELFRDIEQVGVPYEASDKVSIFTLYHNPTDALPDGRFFQWIDDFVLVDTPLPYPNGVQLRRCVDSEVMLSFLGYSTLNDLQGPQEAYNGESSAICTNHSAFGVQNIWVPSGAKVNIQEKEGLQIVRSDVKPEGLNLTQTPAEIFKFRDDIREDMELISGVNSVIRGQPESNLRAGNMLALIDAKGLRYQMPLLRSWRTMCSDVATDIIKTLNDFASPDHERVVTVTGKHDRETALSFSGQSFNNLERVVVRIGNPLSRTMSGRLEITNLFLQAGLIRTPEELINVLETGQTDSLIEGERAQVRLVRDENESMLAGKGVAALATDYHVLHIREHQVPLNSTDVRMNSEVTERILAHIMEHLQLLMSPSGQQLQALLGFQLGAPPLQAMQGKFKSPAETSIKTQQEETMPSMPGNPEAEVR